MRIENGVRRGIRVDFTVDGQTVAGYRGEMLGAALLAAGHHRLRRSPRARMPRGVFCLMGSCQECLVRVDGRPVLACQEPVRAGMDVRLEGEGGDG